MADDPRTPDTPTPPEAATDKSAGRAGAGPLKAEVSRTDAPSAGVSAAPVGPPRNEPTAPKPENRTAASTAATSETSSATGRPTAPAQAAAAKPAPATPAPSKPPSGPSEPPPPADVPPPAFIASLEAARAGSVTAVSYWVGDWTIVVPVSHLLDVGRHLRDAPDAAFDVCSDVTATDWPSRAERFDVIYCLYSTRHRRRVRVKVKAAENQPVPSVTGIWLGANWLEREVFDCRNFNQSSGFSISSSPGPSSG